MNILIIEDEYSLADAIAETLQKENYITKIVTNGEEGEDEALTNIYDLILLDVMLPKKDGFEILKNLKKQRINTPIIMITAKSEISDKLKGLENGIDDYITKPFHMRELLARIKIVLRRNSNIKDDNILEFSDLKLNLNTGEMNVNEEKVSINGKELELLEILLLNKNQIVNKEVLINKIWGYDINAEYNYIEVYASFLRKKLRILKSKVKIKAVRGIGYKLEEKDD